MMAYTSMAVQKLAGNQKYYVNERNEQAEGFGDFMKIGSECLRWDEEDIDIDGWDIYHSNVTRMNCFDICQETDNCVGLQFEYNASTSVGYCGIINDSMSEGQFLIGLTEEQRRGRVIEDDFLSYDCFVKVGKEYQQIKNNYDVPDFFDSMDMPVVTIQSPNKLEPTKIVFQKDDYID